MSAWNGAGPNPVSWNSASQRVLAAGIVGFALPAAGVTLQALLRNPLADPYVLGISSGSTVGVMVWLLATQSIISTPSVVILLALGRSIPAVAGAVVTCLVVFLLARGRWQGGGTGGGAGHAAGHAPAGRRGRLFDERRAR